MNKIKRCIKFILSNTLLIAYLAIIIYMAISTRYTIGYSRHIILQYILIGVLAFIIIDIYIAKKQNLFFTKTDCLMILLVISSTIPLITGKAASLESAIMVTIKYIAIIQMYFITKYIISKNPASKKVIINVFIIIAIVLALVGIEKMTSNKLNLNNFDKTRLESLFNSGNTLAAVVAGAIFLSLGQFGETKRKLEKIFQVANISILTIALILSYSRLMYMTFGIMLLVCFSINKDFKSRKQFFIVILVSIIIGIIYTSFFNKAILTGEYYKIWIGLLIEIIINVVLYLTFCENIEKLTTIKGKKTFAITAIIAIIIALSYVVCVINISKPLTLFNSETADHKYLKVIRNISGNTKYLIEFDIEALGNNEDIFEIIVEERNKYQDYENESSIKFGTYVGKKSIELTTQANTTELDVIFLTTEANENTKLMIKNVHINGKEEILNYKYLPTKLVDKIKNFNLQNKSAWERISFYTDAGSLIKENWLTGIGGDCWKYRYTEYQNYNFISTEVHSYPIQIFLEFGILGILAYIGLITCVIQKMCQLAKKQETNNIGILCTILCVLLHSCFDYDMSFIYVATIVFSLIALTDNETGKKIDIKKSKIINSGLIILTSIIIFNNIIYFLYLVNIKNINKLSREEQENVYNELIKLMPYNIDIRTKVLRYKNNYLEQYKYLLDNEPYYMAENDSFFIYSMYDFVNESIKSNKQDNLETLLRYYNKTKLTKKFYPRYQINRFSTFMAFGEYLRGAKEASNNEYLQNMSQEIYENVIKEIEQKRSAILDYENARYPEKNVKFYEKELQDIYNIIN